MRAPDYIHEYLRQASDRAEGGEVLVYLSFVVELWKFGSSLLQFGSKSLISIIPIFSKIDLPKSTSAQFPYQLEMFAHYQL